MGSCTDPIGRPLIERLRDDYECGAQSRLCDEAADEIERLRAERDEAVSALPQAVRNERERIADLWAGCATDAEGHGLVDIGASIRAGKLIDYGA